MPGRRRRVARRVAFSPYATAVLVTAFSISSTPTKEQREKLAEAIGTCERRVQVWFQNRRQRAQMPPTLQVVPRPANMQTRAATGTIPMPGTSATTQDAYPVCDENDAEDDEESDDADEPEDVPLSVVYGDRNMKEGVVKENMAMTAFTTLFPPFEVRARQPLLASRT